MGNSKSKKTFRKLGKQALEGEKLELAAAAKSESRKVTIVQ